MLASALRLCGLAPGFILALLQGSGADRWRLALQWSLQAIQLLLPDRLGSLPCPSTVPSAREASWSSSVGSAAAWKDIIRLGRKRVVEQPLVAACALSACPLLAAGAQSDDGAVDSVADDELTGMDCGKMFC